MDLDKAIRDLDERLRQLRERVEAARSTFDLEVRFSIRYIQLEAESTRNLANEALAEIRYLDEQLKQLADR
jgi:hypothetical protein